MKRKRTIQSLCHCGCCSIVKPGNRYISGHNMKTKESKLRISSSNKERVVSDQTRLKMSKAHKGRKWPEEFGKKVSESKKAKHFHFSHETKEKMRLAKLGEKSPNWKGGVSKLNQAAYDTYFGQLSFAEEVRRDPDQNHLIQVKCTYCGKWITPTGNNVRNRINSLKDSSGTEMRFYCPGDSCRSQCSLYYQMKYPKGYKQATSREVQPELRKLVFERDKYLCQKCESSYKLQCHHIQPVSSNPIESADIDNCITLCKPCHIEIHKLPGCSSNDLKCKEL